MVKVHKKSPTAFRLTIDPGVNIGWALWSKEEWSRHQYPQRNGCLSRSSGGVWKSTVAELYRLFDRQLAVSGEIKEAYMEMPEYFADANAVATSTSGALVKLSMVAGGVQALLAVRRIPLTLIGIRDWKGQLPKHIVEQRIRTRIRMPEDLPDHVVDAIGIGLWVQGVL